MFDRLPVGMRHLNVMLNLNWSYNQQYSRLIVAPIVDQTCTFMGLIHTNGQFIKNMIGVVMKSLMGLFVCGISLTSGHLISELFPDCTRSCFSQVVLRHRGGDRIYEMRCLFVAVGPIARFIVLPHWDNMS